MKDRNGKEVQAGDTVRYFGRSHDEPWFVGTVTHITVEQYRWDDNREEDVAHIVRDRPDPTGTWRRYGEDIEAT